MYKRILVPHDGSGRSRTVLPHVVELARSLGANVTLVRAVTPMAEAVQESASAYAPNLSIDTAKRRVESEREAAEIDLASIRSDLEAEGIRATAEVIEGNAARVILGVVEAQDIDLICMATRARGALGQLFLGSVADRVVRDAGVPVLLVHAD